MKQFGSNTWVKYLLALGVFMALCATAQAEEKTPHAIVSEVTDILVGAAKANASNDDQAAFDATVLEALEPVVAFDYIARVVMGDHFKQANSEQREQFAKLLKTSLVSTYAKGIATYAESDIHVVPPSEPVADKRRVAVVQEVSYEGESHKLSYTMQKNRSGEWKLTNLILNGVNLGRSLSSQFSQLASRHNGDIDKVINGWEDSDS
ncbi:MAG TPA: ABC transporter substrate-binding protein [Cellvibrionaceae bacterium]